jgi:hypothetical protein
MDVKSKSVEYSRDTGPFLLIDVASSPPRYVPLSSAIVLPAVAELLPSLPGSPTLVDDLASLFDLIDRTLAHPIDAVNATL